MPEYDCGLDIRIMQYLKHTYADSELRPTHIDLEAEVWDIRTEINTYFGGDFDKWKFRQQEIAKFSR